MLRSQWEPSVCCYCGVRTQTEETPGWLCPFRAQFGRGEGGERGSRQTPRFCFPKWAVDQEQGEVRGSPSQRERQETGAVGITQHLQQFHLFFISSGTNISPPSISAPPTGRAKGSGQFYDVNHRVFTLGRTCLLLKTSLKPRQGSSLYLDTSKRTFFSGGAFVSKRSSDRSFKTSLKSI